jgi:transglutaminase/protease-like cytokinesis protein 3
MILVDTIFDDSIIEFHKMKAKDISKIYALSWSIMMMG